jgi:hypothetical protein
MMTSDNSAEPSTEVEVYIGRRKAGLAEMDINFVAKNVSNMCR